MTADRYRTRQLTVEAVQYTGTNLDKVRALAPPGAAAWQPVYREPVILVTTPGRPDRLLHPGDWASWDGVSITLHSPQAFAKVWEPVP